MNREEQSPVYPLPEPVRNDDPRFTFGLHVEVAEVLAAHGYPPVRTGRDLVRLGQALYRFLYVADEGVS
ncbi:hypothetical protein [Amycolatopsis suaedae]|uniref:Uncharacterized protein n=1 Tax=Amycolatopsis suaedae TaxID=2510978 RepID=A0A4Q7J1W6_9PSEU|nr:hypothetical protein [Amycolatopsis suaedae]RZQ60859.1 hypothetical protein EWH70_27560 [Amycolatopsis suaedae]